jgi:hypothetical protein
MHAFHKPCKNETGEMLFTRQGILWSHCYLRDGTTSQGKLRVLITDIKLGEEMLYKKREGEMSGEEMSGGGESPGFLLSLLSCDWLTGVTLKFFLTGIHELCQSKILSLLLSAARVEWRYALVIVIKLPSHLPFLCDLEDCIPIQQQIKCETRIRNDSFNCACQMLVIRHVWC